MPPSEVGTAFIAIRATTAGFAQEARQQVNGEMRSVREAATVPVRAAVTDRAAQESGLKRDVGGMVKNVAAYAGGIFAAAKVFDFAKEVVNEAAAVQKAEESIRAEYGKTAEAVVSFAHGQATSFGISAAASETASARIGALLQNLGLGPSKAAAMNLGLQRVVGAMAEMRNIDPTTVLARLNTTLATGSTRGLRDLGVALDSASIKAEALKLHLPGIIGPSNAVAAAQIKVTAAQKAYNDAVTQHTKNSAQAHAADVALTAAHQNLAKATTSISGTLTVAEKDQAIYGLVTAHSSQLMQEAKKHSGDLAVQQKILSAEWANAKASLGEALLPEITGLFRELVAGVRIVKEYRTEFVSAAAVIATASVAWATYRAAVATGRFVTEVAGGAQKLLAGNVIFSTDALAAQRAAVLGNTTATEAYTAAMAAGKSEQVALTAGTQAATVAQEELDVAMTANPIGILVGAVAVLVGGLYELYEHSATARRIMNETWADMKSLGGAALGFLSDKLGGVGHVIGTFVGDVRNLYNEFTGLRNQGYSMSQALQAVGESIIVDLGGSLGTARTIIGDISDVLGGLQQAFWTTVHDAERVWDAFWGGPFGDEVRFAARLVKGDISQVVSIVRSTIALVKDVITGNWRGAWHDFTNIVGAGLGLAVRLVLTAPALFLHGAVAIGKSIKDPVIREVRALPGQLWSLYVGLARLELQAAAWLGREAIHVGSAILHGIEQEPRKLPGQIRTIIEGLGHVITGLVPWLIREGEKLGSRLVHGAIQGVENLGSSLKSSIENHLKGALSDLNPFSPVEHGAALYIAQPIIQGTTTGLNPFHDELQQSIIPPLRQVMMTGRVSGRTGGLSMGTGITQGIGAGLNPLRGLIQNAIVTASNAAIQGAKRALGISSPSAVYAREIGKPLAEGIVHGMGGLEKALAAKVTSAAKSAMNAMGGFGGGVTPQGGAAVGANQILGRQMMLAAGWGPDQWGALQALWTRESGWNANAVNPSSGAYGIPQSLGHGHPYNLGDARAQIAWGLDYIRARYGSPGAAWAHEESVGWYHQGGVVPGPPTRDVPAMLRGQEVVFTPEQLAVLSRRSVHIGHVTIIANSPQDGADQLNAIAARVA